jgi:hypothetical protein
MNLLTPWALLLLPLALLPFWLKGHQGKVYTWLELMPEDKLSDRLNLAIKVTTSLLLVSIVLALTSPHGHDEKIQRIGKGAQTVMVIDRSVSMDHPFAGDNSGHVAEIKSVTARRIITQFIDSRPDDMMGVVGFTNSALYGVKITTNRDAIHSAILAATSPSLNQTNIGARAAMVTLEPAPNHLDEVQLTVVLGEDQNLQMECQTRLLKPRLLCHKIWLLGKIVLGTTGLVLAVVVCSDSNGIDLACTTVVTHSMSCV